MWMIVQVIRSGMLIADGELTSHGARNPVVMGFLGFHGSDSVPIACEAYEFIRDSRSFSLSSISPQDGGAVPNIPDRIIF